MKDRLGDADFGKINDVLDGAGEKLVADAPATGGGLGGMLSGLAEKLGGEAAGDLAEAVAGFKKLDLAPDKIKGFGAGLIGFLKEKGGDDLGGLVGGILGGDRSLAGAGVLWVRRSPA